ncbi:MAG: nuclear transport factor 2 family protein [Ferruginibacter sp.]
MKKLILILIAGILVADGFTQGLPCSKPVYRQFDFWLGEWEAFGTNGQKAGDSKVSMMLDSCIILEEWTSAASQRGFRYAGKSFNTYNAASKQWQQTWVDNAGGTNEYMQGKFENNQIIYISTPFKFNKDSMAIRKMTFTNLNAEKLRQHGEISKDGGQTWATEYDLEYRRKKDNVAVMVDSILRAMEDSYNKGDYENIAGYYSKNGKVVGANTVISGANDILTYWQAFKRLGGTWKLSNIKTEKVGEQIWQKGISVITDKQGKINKVNFTLVFIQENGQWKILQDAYW